MCSTYIVIITMKKQRLLYIKQSSDDKQAAAEAQLCSALDLYKYNYCVYVCVCNTETKA